MRKKTVRQIAAALLGALVLCSTACGTSYSVGAENSTSGSSSPAPLAQGVTATEIRVGNIGGGAGYGSNTSIPFNIGLQAYFDMVNQSGGISGRKIVLRILEHDPTDAQASRSALRTLVEDEQVFALVGHLGRPVIDATLDQIYEYGIPCVYPVANLSRLYNPAAQTAADGRALFPVQPLVVNEARAMLAYAGSHFGAHKIGIVLTSDFMGTESRSGFEEMALQVSNIQLETVVVDPDSDSLQAGIAQLVQTGCEAVLLGVYPRAVQPIAAEMVRQGLLVPTLISHDSTVAEISQLVQNELAAGFLLYGLSWLDFQDVATLQQFAQYAPEEYWRSIPALLGWVAGYTFCEGLRRMQDPQNPTWNGYVQAMESQPLSLPFGIEVNYASGNRRGVDAFSLYRACAFSDTTPEGWLPETNITPTSTLI